MKISQETPLDTNLIHEYGEQFIVIKTKNSALVTIDTSLILTSNHVVTDYILNPITDFSISDINYIKNLDPEVVILTNGSSVQLPPQIIVNFSEQAIGVEVMSLGAACRTYNLLVSEGRRVVLVLNFE
ncbi:MAG: hypothetical protein HRT92_06695 [Piscirickettsiaceae bacterium]|nr:hypothetical protein [Piscirickettsiaceae bacterium]